MKKRNLFFFVMKKEKQIEQKVHRHSLTYTYEQTSEKNGERMKAESVESQRNINSSMEREASERAAKTIEAWAFILDMCAILSYPMITCWLARSSSHN